MGGIPKEKYNSRATEVSNCDAFLIKVAVTTVNITDGLRRLLALTDISQSFSQYHQLVVQLTTWR